MMYIDHILLSFSRIIRQKNIMYAPSNPTKVKDVPQLVKREQKSQSDYQKQQNKGAISKFGSSERIQKMQSANNQSTALYSKQHTPFSHSNVKNTNQSRGDIRKMPKPDQSQSHRPSIQLREAQRERLRRYFKYHCEMTKSYPKLATFDSVRNILHTLNLTEWMVFCKNVGITQRFRGGKQRALKALTSLYQKYEDQEKRLDFDKFQILVCDVITDIAEQELHTGQHKQSQQRNTQNQKQQKIQEIIVWLNLNDNKKQNKALREIGVMCSDSSYAIKKSTINKLKACESSCMTDNGKSIDMGMDDRFDRSTIPRIFDETGNSQQTQKSKNKLPKIYKNFKQKQQSKLMQNLAVTNLHRLMPNDDTKNFLSDYIGENDIYLKQYFKKQDQGKGVTVPNRIPLKTHQNNQMNSIQKYDRRTVNRKL